MKYKAITLLSFAGLLFSGFLAGTRFFSGKCSLDFSCSYFLGNPTCYYGFFLFLALAVFAVMMQFCDAAKKLKMIFVVSLAGVAFAGVFAVKEIMAGVTSALGLPTCAYGFIVFAVITILSFRALSQKKTD